MRPTRLVWTFAALPLLSCTSADPAPAAAPALQITERATRFVVREHMLAAVEMQLSGEPFAEAMGRDLSGYSRDFRPPEVYFDPTRGQRPDVPGFSSGVESYEYSKQPMNNLAFESGAGLSLAYGPLLDPAAAGGAPACAALRDRVQRLGAASNATSRFVSATATAANPLGWPGLWPTLSPFVSFDPAVAPTNAIALACSITSDDDPGSSGSLLSDDYECDATSLHLPDRAHQADLALSPGASGWSGWKSALWVLNYLQSMHDSAENAIDTVSAGDLATVGAAGNTVLGTGDGTTPTVAGTFLGSSDIEGFQAAMMLTGLDNEAEHWLRSLTTTDGATLSGFADLRAALAYDGAAPLRWFPAEVAVTESADPACAFPRATGFSVRAGGSRLLDVAGLLGAYASVYALTDHANGDVGGSQPARAYFDGDPFADDDQMPDAEATLHDRSLAMMRVLVVDLARMHRDPASGLPVDEVTVANGAPARGATLSAPSAAYALLALRTARRALSSQLALYSNNTPDSATLTTPLDAVPVAAPELVSGTLNTMIASLADLFFTHLTDASGRAWSGWDLARQAHTDEADSLDAHTAAARGLFVAYLATGDTRYRDRGLAVFRRVEARFYDAGARLYRTTAGDTGATVTYTPLRFGMLQAMLRDTYELVGMSADQQALADLIETRVGRLNALVLNGWDDRDDDQSVDWPSECIQVSAGLPRGGLQMAERTLTGETGSDADRPTADARVVTTDRDHDCVPEISAAGLPAALADSITLHIGSAAP